MAETIKYGIKPQKPMRAMLIGLSPCLAMGVYLFGWRSLALTLFCCLACYLVELIFEAYRGGQPTESVLVSGALIGLSLPPYTPYWIAAVGCVFGITFAKQVFGGFGKNVFNPAITARAFLYVCFPIQITSQWMAPGQWPMGRLDAYAPMDALTSATPLITFQQSGASPDLQDLIIGTIPGSIGETSAIAILLGGAYIIYKKAADWRYPLSCLLGAMALNALLYYGGVKGVLDPLSNLFAGSLLFGAFFMVTEPVSGCARPTAKWIYGFFIGVLWMVIRSFSSFPEATSFAILLGNTFGPLFDEGVIEYEKWKKSRRSAQ